MDSEDRATKTSPAEGTRIRPAHETQTKHWRRHVHGDCSRQANERSVYDQARTTTVTGLAAVGTTVDGPIGGAETAAGSGPGVDDADDAAGAAYTYAVQTAGAGAAAGAGAGAADVVGDDVDNDAMAAALTAHTAAESTRCLRMWLWRCSSLGSAGFGPRSTIGVSRTAAYSPGAACMPTSPRAAGPAVA